MMKLKRESTRVSSNNKLTYGQNYGVGIVSTLAHTSKFNSCHHNVVLWHSR